MDNGRLEILRDIAGGFDTHDVARIMRHFAHDAVFESPRGRGRWGDRYEGTDAIGRAFAARFESIPDVRYRDVTHFVAGDRAASQWTLSGTTRDGARLDLHGCDLWTLKGNLVIKKDSYWKMRTEP